MLLSPLKEVYLTERRERERDHEKSYPIGINDINNDGKFSVVRSIIDEDDSTNFNDSLKQTL